MTTSVVKLKRGRRRQGGVNKHVSRKYKKENEHISTFYLEHVTLMVSLQMNLISFFNYVRNKKASLHLALQ